MNKKKLYSKLEQALNNIKPCKAPFWLRNGNLQTLLIDALKKNDKLKNKKYFLLSLKEKGEKLYIEYLEGKSNTVIYLFHGLTGSSNSIYIRRIAKFANEKGHHVYLFNHRASGKGVGLAKKPYHSGRAEDLSALIQYGRKKHPKHLHIGIGFSLSGNAILLLAAKIRAKVLPDIVISVNPPIDNSFSVDQLNKGFNKIYNFYFLNQAKKLSKKNGINPKKHFPNVRNIREFDETFTAPRSGFKSAEHYYQICSAKRYLSKINIPTLILTSKDDPFVSIDQFHNLSHSKYVKLRVENYGGHLGYVASENFLLYDWLTYCLGKIIEKVS